MCESNPGEYKEAQFRDCHWLIIVLRMVQGFIWSKKYKDQPHITVLKAEKNLGFARGNNIGYTYASRRCMRIIYV